MTIGYYGRPFEARNKVCCVCAGRRRKAKGTNAQTRREEALRGLPHTHTPKSARQPSVPACPILPACHPLRALPFLPQAKGGAFTGDEKEFYRFVLGSNTVIPAFEEAVAGMQASAPGPRRRGAVCSAVPGLLPGSSSACVSPGLRGAGRRSGSVG